MKVGNLSFLNLVSCFPGVHGCAPDDVDQDDVLVVLDLHGARHQEQDPQRARPPGPLRPRRPQGARHAHVHHRAGHGLQRPQALPAITIWLSARGGKKSRVTYTYKVSIECWDEADEVIGVASGQNILPTSYVTHPGVDSSALCVG